MRPAELKSTTMDPAHRTLRKVVINDMVPSVEELMGDTVQPRKWAG
jgi:DNA gyrase/topoisomerase IV subunit B